MVIPRIICPLLVWRILLLGFLILSGFVGFAPVPAIAAGPPPPVKPHDRYALIFGTVWGPDGHPVYGVTVKLRRARDKRARWEIYSNHRGEFAQRVPAGKADYVVWADLKGFQAPGVSRLGPGQQVTVHVENDERLDIGLHLTAAIQ